MPFKLLMTHQVKPGQYQELKKMMDCQIHAVNLKIARN